MTAFCADYVGYSHRSSVCGRLGGVYSCHSHICTVYAGYSHHSSVCSRLGGVYSCHSHICTVYAGCSHHSSVRSQLGGYSYHGRIFFAPFTRNMCRHSLVLHFMRGIATAACVLITHACLFSLVLLAPLLSFTAVDAFSCPLGSLHRLHHFCRLRHFWHLHRLSGVCA